MRFGMRCPAAGLTMPTKGATRRDDCRQVSQSEWGFLRVLSRDRQGHRKLKLAMAPAVTVRLVLRSWNPVPREPPSTFGTG